MSFLNIQSATREGAKTVFGFAGVSGSGKTYSALLFGYGLANRNASKLGFLDTENRRGRLYADILPNKQQFQIADFPAPHSPARYVEAIRQFEDAGVEVLVIDSVTHEWEGIGGCEDIACDGNPKVKRWNTAKTEHKKFMNALLQSSMHIIVCIRAREKVKMHYVNGKTEFEPLGIMPIQEKNFMFELTGSLMMQDQGKRQDVLKCPAAILTHFGRSSDYIGVKDGEAIRAWIDGATPVDRLLESERAKLSAAAELGTEALKMAWNTAKPEVKAKLKDELDGLKSAAAAYDEQRKIASAGDTSDAVDAVNALVGE